MAAMPTRIVADVRLWSVCGSSPLRRRDYIRRPQLLTHCATGRRQAHLTKGYSPKCVEYEFSEVRLRHPHRVRYNGCKVHRQRAWERTHLRNGRVNVTTSRWIVILATVLVSGGVAWLLKLVAIAILVVTGARDIESGAVAFFYLTGLGLLFIGSTALGLRLTMSRQGPLRIAAVVLSPILFWVSYQILDGIADGIVGAQAPNYVQSETAVLVAALVWLAMGARLLKSTSQTRNTRVA
jgi:hypothetical protein